MLSPMQATSSALGLLPSRIANKLSTLDSLTLRAIRNNRLRRKGGSYALHKRRHLIFVACCEIANTKRQIPLRHKN